MFKAAADRVNQLRDEKEQLQRVVDDSERREAAARSDVCARQREDAVAAAAEHLAALEGLVAEAAALARLPTGSPAREEVPRIQQIDSDVDAGERMLADLALGRPRQNRR